MLNEDIQPGYAPKELVFMGYKTHNLHHSADAAKAFQQTIAKAYNGEIKNLQLVRDALMHTDQYMKLNDMHLEQGIAPDEKELEAWRHAHNQARMDLERVGEFMHHEDYWHMHGHELEGMEAKFTPETAGSEFADSYTPEGNMVQEELTKTLKSADRVKVARVIADMLGVENAESMSPDTAVNQGLRKIKNKRMTPEFINTVKKMVQLAQEVGIKVDSSVIPSTVAEEVVSEAKEESNGILSFNKFAKISKINKGVVPSSPKTSQAATGSVFGEEKPAVTIDLDDANPNDEDDAENATPAATDIAAQKLEKQGPKVSSVGHTLDGAATSDQVRRMKVAYKTESVDLNNIGPKQRAAIKDLRPGSKTSFDDAAGQQIHAHREGDKVHLVHHSATASNKKTVSYKQFDEGVLGEWAVMHDGVDADHPNADRFHGKKDVINHLTKYKSDADQRANYLKKKGFKNVRIEEGKDYSVTVTHYKDGEHTKHEYIVKNANDRKHAKNIAMQKHGKKIGGLKAGEQYGTSSTDTHELTNEEVNLEESPQAHKVSVTVSDPNHSAVTMRKEKIERRVIVRAGDKGEAQAKAEAFYKKRGYKVHGSEYHSVQPATSLKTEQVEIEESTDVCRICGCTPCNCTHIDINEDMHSADYKINPQTGRKYRAKHIDFANSKMGGSAVGVEDRDGGTPSDEDSQYDNKKPKKDNSVIKVLPEEHDNEHEDLELSDADLEKMADEIDTEDEVLDAYDEDELVIVDQDTGEIVSEVKEEVEQINEVLSRMERMRAKIRFARTSSKRARRLQIALRSRSSAAKINKRARTLAVKLMKQRLIKKPLSQMTVGEKERAEQIIARRKAVINRLAMKLAPRIRKIENARLSHSKVTK